MRYPPLLLLLAIVAGCVSMTAPVVVRELVPPDIDTTNIESVALLPSKTEGENKALDEVLEKEIAKAIEATARYRMKRVPAGLAAGSQGEIIEAARAAGADLLVQCSVLSRKSKRSGSTLEVAYSFYSGSSGEELLSKTLRASGAGDDYAVRGVAEGITSSLMPHGVERTLLLEYSLNKLNDAGVELALKGIWDQAERQWWIAVRRNQNDPAAYHNLGVAFEVRGFYGRAKTAYENAFVRNPQSPLYSEDIERIKKLLGLSE